MASKILGGRNMVNLAFKKCLAVMALGFLSACTSSNPEISSSSDDQHVKFKEFTDGKSFLDCDVACSGSWGWIRDELELYYNTNRWERLANTVLSNGHNVDLNYFYLGSAAEGLGYNHAAITYYKSAIHGNHKCDGILNNCDGINVPKLASSRLAVLERNHKRKLKSQSSDRSEKKPAQKVATQEKQSAPDIKKSNNNADAKNDRSRAKEYSWNQLNKKLVASRMKDPDSVKFSDVFFSDKFGTPTTCGRVNATNSFGAYSGYQRFIGVGSTMGPFLESDVSDFDKLWRQMCR
jgi:hypothetical protein